MLVFLERSSSSISDISIVTLRLSMQPSLDELRRRLRPPDFLWSVIPQAVDRGTLSRKYCETPPAALHISKISATYDLHSSKQFGLVVLSLAAGPEVSERRSMKKSKLISDSDPKLTHNGNRPLINKVDLHCLVSL